MKIERLIIQACCGRKQIVFKFDRSVDLAMLQHLVSNGFTEAKNFTKVGMVYADNPALIVSGSIGADRLNAKCKKKDANCDQILNDFEELLLKMG